MKLLTKKQFDKLIENGRANDRVRGTQYEIDFEPVVKLFNPQGAGTWLLTEIDPRFPDLAFGLCYVWSGVPEIGSVSLKELEAFRGKFGLGIERDIHWTPNKTLMGYANEASGAGRIVA
jgi:hypothetical protein